MTSTSSLHGKTAIITGGSQGIGAAIALQFSRKAIKAIAITYVSNLTLAEETISRCLAVSPTLKIVAIQADILDPEVGEKLISTALEKLSTKTIDIIVNNAALISESMLQPLSAASLDIFSKVMQGNCYAPVKIINAALPHLPAKGGRIINISSLASKVANPDTVAMYGASKAALDSVTRSLGLIHGEEKGATFNSVSVGAVRTTPAERMVEQMGKEVFEAALGQQTAGKRFAEPEDVAFIVGFLASEEARWINGQQIPANGGWVSGLALQG